jgi:spore coat polysaccharide biosynthesis protein SpsF
MNIGIIIQARTGSTRLPEKMLLPFYNKKGILENLLLRIREHLFNVPVLVATTTNKNDDTIEQIAKNNGISVYRGSEDDVLDRFIKAAEFLKIEKIIRICADNPFLDINALKIQIADFLEQDVDYWYYAKRDNTPTIKTHYGFWTEGVTLTTLKKIDSLTKEKLFHEHVTNYIYTYPDCFKLHAQLIPIEIEKETNIRLTIDTKEDFELAKSIYSLLIKNQTEFNPELIVSFIKSNKDWLILMENEINKNIK